MNVATLDGVLRSHYGAFADSFRRLSATEIEGAVITGSGLNSALDGYEASEVFDTREIKGFPQPGVAGHSSFIRVITIEGKRMAHFTGRCHLYEGFSLREALSSVGLARLLGARFAVITNAAGGLNPLFSAGDIMTIAETLNLLFRPTRRGALAELLPAMNVALPAGQPDIFPKEWRKRIGAELTARRVPYREGTYIALTGPTYETPAEARMYRRLGGCAIGMSTAHEAEFARACGMSVAGCSLITNTLPEALPVTVSHDEVVDAARVGAEHIAEFIAAACQTAA